jgi:D-alanyl-D-alanine carboxypeptidase
MGIMNFVMFKRRRLILFIVVLFLVLGGASWVVAHRDNDATHTYTDVKDLPVKASSSENDAQPKPAFSKTQHSLTDPASPWIIVNKQRPLSPVTYAPPLATPNIPLRLDGSVSEMKVSTQMSGALEKLAAGAKAAGLQLMLASGYRSYQQQITVYNAEVKNYGKTVADSESARPGYSEHQTGLAADLEPASHQCEIQDCFGTLPEGQWLAEHAYEYGFVIRYQQGSEKVTGYKYEPWHVRYVGVDLAKELHAQNNPLLEDYFGVGPAADY